MLDKQSGVTKNMRDGFTLAETLITLGIVGIVAAMTIPNLIKNYQDRARLTALKKSYSVISNAHKLVVNDIGEYWKVQSFVSHDSAGWHVMDETRIVESYAENLNGGLSRYCGKTSYPMSSNGCKNIVKGGWIYLNGETTTYNFIGEYNRMVESFQYELKDGSHINLTFASGHWNLLENKIMVLIRIDINGYKEPNQIGKDTFFFALKSNEAGIVPLNYSGIDNAFIGQKSNKIYPGIENYDLSTQKDCTESGTGYSCAYAIIHNNWEFPKNYHNKNLN